MIKKGFTLQEALITLVTIGIIAAIAIPRLARIAPDQNHTKYLKAYAQLTSLTNEMLVDPALYFCNDSNGLDCTNMPNRDAIPGALFNRLNGVANNGNLTAIDKYVQILAYKMNLQTDIYNTPNGAQVFRTKDGIAWIFAQNNQNAPIQVDIDMDGISRQAGNDIAIQNGNETRMPDRFMFNIAMDGTVTAADPMGQFYLDNSTNLHLKSADKLNTAIDTLKTDIEEEQFKYRNSINVSDACSNGVIMVCRRGN